MPTVRNDGTKPVVIGSEIVGPGIGPVAVKKYPHPDQTDVVLVSDEPRTNTPVLLFGDTLPSGTIDGLAAYRYLDVYNKSGNDITIVYNGDTDNADIWPNGTRFVRTNFQDYHSMTITGDGTTNVYVWGTKASADDNVGLPILSRVA